MASKKVWAKEETLELIRIYKSSPDSRHMHYKDRDKRSMCWQSMGEALDTSVGELQRKIHNLRNQVSNHVRFCKLIMYVNVQSVLPSMFGYGDVPCVSFWFSFFFVN
jgi:histone deacetylase complex regulatory component SIN3